MDKFILTTPDELQALFTVWAADILQRHRPATIEVLPADEPLTPDETAALLKTSKVSLWSWEKKGIIKGYHLGNKKYFLRSEIMSALTKKGGATV